ncbi:FAD binding domain-containing protein [Sarocladium implicatum]|nr:FAD binding domain-containing protein [Sarocladium implicatum]
MAIRIIIVGAGIGGLTAAVALRQAGCQVTIFEKSAFLGEIGAALAITPNGAQVLERLGFSFTKARTCTLNTWSIIDGVGGKLLNELDLRNAEKDFGTPLRTVHRVDLHSELVRLATAPDASSFPPVDLRIGCLVAESRPDGTVVLQDGSEHTADLVVGADGLRSVVRPAVVDEGAESTPVHSGQSAFRFLVDTSTFQKDPHLAELTEKNQGRLSLFADTKETERERHMIWYGCRDGEVQNFVGIHPSDGDKIEEGDEAKTFMKQEFSHFESDVQKILDLAEDVKRWPLFIQKPFPTWVNGRIVLIGDAAHPMLPFGGQGAMMAIEDGGVLGFLLKDAEPESVDARLALFQQLRRNRASRVQTLSKVRVGREKEAEAEVRQYTDSPDAWIPTSHKERIVHDYRYDAYGEVEKALGAAK